MSRIYLWVLCLAVLGLAVRVWSLAGNSGGIPAAQNVPAYTSAEMQGISYQTVAFESERLAQQRFRETLASACRDMLQGLDLRQATARVWEAAHTHYPKYLFHIRPVEPGSTEREQVAHNLIKDLEVGLRLETSPPETVRRVQQLRAECQSPAFQNWCAETP